MTPAHLTASPLDAEDLRARVHKALDDVLAHQAAVLDEVSPDLAPLMDAVGELLRGGKRLRAAFCYWGWRGAGGPDVAGAVWVAASLELFQGAALIHDDVMDGSDIRRGMPAVHRRFAALHRGNGWLGSPETFGVAGAVLGGDLCLSWCDEMYAGSGLAPEALHRGRTVFDRMRTELMCGQYLDMLAQVRAETSVAEARHVIRHKSANYTVAQPLLLGGTLAGAAAELLSAYEEYGLALGEAFQLRDDVLGVFGDPDVTGKPTGDDLREGKRTVLVAATMERASPAQAAELRRSLGDPHLDIETVARLRALMVETGALQAVERLIDELCDTAWTALARADTTPETRQVLERLVVTATARTG
ncbi:MAG: geranylgeranyl diphosphate synthase, type [Actinomycetota bacterium]|nr:geranylgeranyl diphosphate synthase, type [Actinomycetota bacterium]